MDFKNRYEAGLLLAQHLQQYKNKNVLVLGLPRGGVVTASAIAHELQAPLDVIIAHKIGHPHQPEYAIAAIAEGGHIMENLQETQTVPQDWYKQAIERELQEIRRRRKKYVHGTKEISLQNMIVILVDDGIATGLTMKAAILSVQAHHPKKIIVAVPVAPKSTAKAIQSMVDECIGLEVPDDWSFRGAVGAYYQDFAQTTDEEVISLLKENKTREET